MEKPSKLKLKNYLTIGKPVIAPDSLDPNVFYFPETGEAPILQRAINAQIINDIENFCGEQHQRIKNYVLVGDALIPGNTNRVAPLKVLLILNKSLMDLDIDGILSGVILKAINAISNRLAVGTLRPIIYTPTVIDDMNKLSEMHQGMYNLATHKWIKLPSGLKHA
jgi:hypothetical protein